MGGGDEQPNEQPKDSRKAAVTTAVPTADNGCWIMDGGNSRFKQPY